MKNKKKDTKKERKSVKKQRAGNDFFQADWNDDVYVQRTIAKKGSLGGRRLG